MYSGTDGSAQAAGSRPRSGTGDAGDAQAIAAKLRAILEVAHALVAAEDEQELLASIAEVACRTLGYDSCNIALDDGQGTYRVRASFGSSAQTLQAIEATPLSVPAYRQVAAAGVVIGSVRYLSAATVIALPSPVQDYLQRSGAPVPAAEHRPAPETSPEKSSTGLILVPLTDAAGTQIGYLNPDRSTVQPSPTSDEALLLETLAQLAVVALTTTRARTAERGQRELAETRQRQLEALLRASATIRGSVRLDDVLSEIAAAMTGAGGFRRVAIYLLDHDSQTLHARASAGLDGDEAERLYDTPVPRAQFDPLTREEMRIGRSFLFDHRCHQLPPELMDVLSIAPDDGDWEDGQWHPLDSLTVPMLDPDGVEIGLLSVDEPVGRLFPDRSHIDALEFFADQCGIAVRQASAYRAVEARAHTDALTGLANRGAADEQLDRLLGSGSPVAVLFCDLDLFKTVNDRYGHAAGDGVLQAVAHVLRDTVRPSDLVARYGGEEFLVALTGVDAPAAVMVAEKIRRAVEAAELGTDPVLRATVSIGLAMGAGLDRGSVLQAADRALYAAKKTGRNRVCPA